MMKVGLNLEAVDRRTARIALVAKAPSVPAGKASEDIVFETTATTCESVRNLNYATRAYARIHAFCRVAT
jgi:hypothetical protein